MSKPTFECGICRESDSSPWRFYIGDLGIFDATHSGLISALLVVRGNDKAVAEVFNTWVQAVVHNAPRFHDWETEEKDANNRHDLMADIVEFYKAQ